MQLDNHRKMECNRIIPTSRRHSHRYLYSPYGSALVLDPSS